MKKAKRIMLGAAVSLALYMLLLALVSALAVRGSIGEQSFVACVWVSAFLSALLGIKVSVPTGKERAAIGAGCAFAFWGSVLLLGFMTNDTLSPARAGELLLPIGLGFALSELLRGKGERTKRRRRYKK